MTYEFILLVRSNRMANTVERFLTEFNKLHDAMQDKLGKNDDFYSLLKIMEKDLVISRFKDQLHIIRQLRNLLVHEKKTMDYDLATPSEEVIEQLIFVREQLIQPVTAGDHFSRKVFSFNIDDSLERLLYFLDQKHLYQFPIFDEEGLAGVISHNGITNWLAHNYSQEHLDFSEVKIRDIVADEESYYHYEVIKSNTSLFDVEAMFSSNLLVGRSQYLILISDQEDIKKWTDLKGIITPWDLPEVLTLIR